MSETSELDANDALILEVKIPDSSAPTEDAPEPPKAAEAYSEVLSGYDEEDPDQDTEYADLFIQHGAHRTYQVPERLIVQKATHSVSLDDGEELGLMLTSRSLKSWEKVDWRHVTIVGGINASTKKQQTAPFVCFNVKGSDCDDHKWLRPVPSIVYPQLVLRWKSTLKELYAKDEKKLAKRRATFKPVLTWLEEMLCGAPKLNPEVFGTGEGGFKVVPKLRTACVKSQPIPRGVTPSKPAPTIQKAAHGKARAPAGWDSSDAGTSAETEEPATPLPKAMDVQARTVWLGDKGKVYFYENADGVYATVLP